MPTSALMTDLLPMGATRTPVAARRPEPKTETRDFGRVLEDSRQNAGPRQNAADLRGPRERQEPRAKSAPDRGENPSGLRKQEMREKPKHAEAPEQVARPAPRDKNDTDHDCECQPAEAPVAAEASATVPTAETPVTTENTTVGPLSAELITEVKISTDPALAPEAIPESKPDAPAAVMAMPTASSPSLEPATVVPPVIATAAAQPGDGQAVAVGPSLDVGAVGGTGASASVALVSAGASSIKAMATSAAATPVTAEGKDGAIEASGDEQQAAKGGNSSQAKGDGKAVTASELSATSIIARESTAAAGKASEPVPQSQGAAPVSQPDITTPMKAADPAQALARADAPVPLQAVAVEIGMRAMRGSREFSIRLDPEDLGRIDIKLEISEAGQVQAKLVVERVETLHLLQRDAKTLERAFDQAGLKTNPDGLQFSLRDPGQQGRQTGQQDQTPKGQSFGATDRDTGSIDEIAPRTIHYRTTASGGLDIRI